jgi:hypothetical protein
MDFIFMLTRDDRTVEDCLELVELIRPIGLKHMGFKDLGVSATVLKSLAQDASPLGAAFLASVAAGLAGSVDEAVGHLPLHLKTVEPDPAKSTVYEDAYQRYRALFEALVPLYGDRS